jgi:hypothetical protein
MMCDVPSMAVFCKEFIIIIIIQIQTIFPLVSVPRPALRPTQPPIQWVPGVISPGVERGRGVTLNTHSI